MPADDQRPARRHLPPLPDGHYWPDPEEPIPSYSLPPREGTLPVFHSPEDDARLGPMREAEVYEEEHHLYTVPFRYPNVRVDFWLEYADHGVELLAELGQITIEEAKPIIAVTVVGSGCSGAGYNVVEWWGEGETVATTLGQLIRRQRVDDLHGQHIARVHELLMARRDFESLDEASRYLEELRRVVYTMTSGYSRPGSIMNGLFENTVYFRVGDAVRFSPERSFAPNEAFRTLESVERCHRVTIRAGGMDYEDPGTERERYPADYAIRLIDVTVRK